MSKRSILVVAPEGFGVTTQTITDKMNEKFNAIKKVNPKGFMDEFESQFDLMCFMIANEKNGNVDFRETIIDGKITEEIVFYYGVSLDQANKMLEQTESLSTT